MTLTAVDFFAFAAFVLGTIACTLYASRRDGGAREFFLAGRSLGFWLIGFSLIASNISTEQFVGAAGASFGSLGLAVAAYEWIAAITLVGVGFWLLPRFLRAGIYTVPQYLEVRFGGRSRRLMSIYLLVMYALVAMASILYSGALGLQRIFGFDLTLGVWLLGGLSAGYTIYGGLRAVVWSDLIQGIALLLGAAGVTWLGVSAAGGWKAVWEANADRLHLVLPASDPDIPWTALLLGMWVPHIFYWGLNQFIMQRALGARSLAAAQRGIILAAGIKLLIPFVVVLPGIVAHQLYASEIATPDQAYPVLISKLLPEGLRGLMLAALFGAIMSTLDSLTNSASTLYTLDLHRYFHPDSSSEQLVRVGRWATLVFIVVGCAVAPWLGNPSFGGIFKYIQMFQGFISPGIVMAFVLGLTLPRASEAAALSVLVANVPIYGLLLWLLPNVAFLNHMAFTVIALAVIGIAVTLYKPRERPFLGAAHVSDGESAAISLRSTGSLPPLDGALDLSPSRGARTGGALVVAVVALLYTALW